jgi:hypothetical protein
MVAEHVGSASQPSVVEGKTPNPAAPKEAKSKPLEDTDLKLAAFEVALKAEEYLKSRWLVISIVISLTVIVASALGGGAIVYSVLTDKIIDKQTAASEKLTETQRQQDSLIATIGRFEAKLDGARLSQEKLFAETKADLAEATQRAALLEASRSQLSDNQNRVADSLEDYFKRLDVQQQAIAQLLSDPKIQALVDSGKTTSFVATTDSTRKAGESALATLRSQASNYRVTVFLHCRTGCRTSDTVVAVSEWLKSAGFVVGGLDEDGASSARVDYFDKVGGQGATIIANYLKEKFPDLYGDIKTNKETVSNRRGYVGLYL